MSITPHAGMLSFVTLAGGVFWPLSGGSAGETMSKEEPSACEAGQL